MPSACPDPTLLDAFASGRLEGAGRGTLEAHLDACPDCARVVAELLRLYGSELAPSNSHSGNASLPYAQTIAVALRSDAPPAPKVGRYQIGERIGEGGMGVVFVAHDPELDRRVAVKLLHPNPDGNLEAQRARLMREAQAMAKLTHPNVVAVHDVGRVGDQLFLAMELVEGTTLTRWLRTAPRTRDEIVSILGQAGRGLAAAHAVGLVHRDFKPDNVLVGADGRARVTDFGVARPLGVEARSGLAEALHQPQKALAETIPGALVGTPAYMAPEQLRSEPADARSDQFAFCVSLYESLFRDRPFPGKTLRELVVNVLSGKMTPPPASTPRWLRAIVMRGLAIAPEQRFPSMDALLVELTRDHGRLRRALITGGAMTVGAVAIVALLDVATRSRSPSTPAASPSASSSLARTAPPSCAEPRRDPRESWSVAQSDRIEAAFDVEKPKWAREVASEVKQGLDHWIAEWVKAHDLSCAPVEAGVVEEGETRARMACLEWDGRVFSALAEELTRPGAEVSEHALQAIEALPVVTRCVAPNVEARWPAPAVDAGARAKIALLDVETARLWARITDGRLLDTGSDAKRLVETAKAIGDPATSARVLFVAGHHALLSGRGAVASERLEGAAQAAEAVGDGDLVLRAATDLVVVEGAMLDRPKEAARWQAAAESELARAGSDPDGVAPLAASIAAWQIRLGKWVDATASLRRALEARASRNEPQIAAIAAAHAELSHALAVLARLDDSEREAHAAIEMAEGMADDHPLVATGKIALAEALTAEGRPTDALTELEAARDIREQGLHIYDTELARAARAFGRAYEVAGRIDDAQRELETEDRLLEARSLLDDPEAARGLLDLSAFALAHGHAADGRDRAKDALALLARMGVDEDVPIAAEAHLALGAASLGWGKAIDPIKEDEQAIALLAKRFSDLPPCLAEAQWALGLAQEKAGALADAGGTLSSAWWSLQAALGEEHPRVGRLLADRARIAEALGNTSSARTFYVDAEKILSSAYGAGDPQAKAIAEALAKLPP